MSLVLLQARPPPLTGGRVYSGQAQSTDANGGARGAPARAPDAFESPFDGGRRRTVVRSGRAMRRGSMSRVENKVGGLWKPKRKGASGQRKMELADEKVEKPALFPSPSFNSVPFFLFLSPSLLPLSSFLLLGCWFRPYRAPGLPRALVITVREGVEEKERGGKGGVHASPFPLPSFSAPSNGRVRAAPQVPSIPFDLLSLRRKGEEGRTSNRKARGFV